MTAFYQRFAPDYGARFDVVHQFFRKEQSLLTLHGFVRFWTEQQIDSQVAPGAFGCIVPDELSVGHPLCTFVR